MHLQLNFVMEFYGWNLTPEGCQFALPASSLLYVCSVWHDTAIPFHEVIQQFEDWLVKHHLWEKEAGGFLNKAAFVTW